MKQSNKIRGQIVKQNSQEFIICIFSIKQILKFTKYTKRLIVSYDENEKPIYNQQVQREVESARVERIADFLIHDPLASFPTNIVLGIPGVCIEEQKVIENNKDTEISNQIEISLKDNVFEQIKRYDGDVFITIIDGQHRIRGIEIAIERLQNDINSLTQTLKNSNSSDLQIKLDKARKKLQELEELQLAVSFFIDPSLEYQAMIFSTINRTQKRVSQNLVNSLFGLDTNDTPQKTALEITLSLNSHPASPFYKRINLYGSNYNKNQSPPLSQGTMIRSIVNLISENSREAENDRFKKRSELLEKPHKSDRFLPFRYFYGKNQDNIISNILFYFYNTIKKVLKDPDGKSYWDGPTTNILQTTVGYEALLKILTEILEKNQYQSNTDLCNGDSFYIPYIEKVRLINFANRERYPFSTRGKNILYLEMSLTIFPSENINDPRKDKLNNLLNNG